ncbi:DUF2267 domain-containing protein [Hyphomonas sp.]|uniref:DUF2267 domain-containing protein n=1 Tax=Hyphomonas sp. TaxID=87 RepID=UPI0030024018
MSTTGLSQFDDSLHHTNSWLKDIMEDLGWADRPAAYSALRASLHALRDRLTIEEGAHLAAQLPLMLKGVFYDGWKPANCGGKNRSVDRFLAPLEDIFGDDDSKDGQAIAEAVFRVLRKHVSAGEVRHIEHALPQPIRELFSVA